MDHRFACEPLRDVSGDMDALLAACGSRRTAHLARLYGERREASLNAQRLCRSLWAELAARPAEDFRIETDENGRPFAPEAPAYLSLSHSGGYAAAAASFAPVGIDLQALRPVSGRVLARRCSDAERAWISEAPETGRTARAIRLWTMKEAYGKMLGVGIFSSASGFSASFAEGQLLLAYDDARFLLPEAPTGYLLTVCLPPGG